MTDNKLLPSSVAAFTEALKGSRGSLDAWLEVNDEREVAAHVEAYARANVAHATAQLQAEIEALRAEVKVAYAAADSKAGWEWRKRAERLAEVLRYAVDNPEFNSETFDKMARAALCVGMGGVRTALTEAGWRPAMVERQEVEALLLDIDLTAFEHKCQPADATFEVEGDTLAALCRAWLAAEAEHTVDLSQCSQVTRHLIWELIQRDAHGRAKYGTTLDREDLSPEQWLQHMKEELLDGAGYAEACIRKLHKSKENI